jgi:hypothetical protein
MISERLGQALAAPGETKVLLYLDGKHCKPVSATVVWFKCDCLDDDCDEYEVIFGLVDELGTSWDDVGELFVDVE